MNFYSDYRQPSRNDLTNSDSCPIYEPEHDETNLHDDYTDANDQYDDYDEQEYDHTDFQNDFEYEPEYDENYQQVYENSNYNYDQDDDYPQTSSDFRHDQTIENSLENSFSHLQFEQNELKACKLQIDKPKRNKFQVSNDDTKRAGVSRNVDYGFTQP